jgi:hypothetical protein
MPPKAAKPEKVEKAGKRAGRQLKAPKVVASRKFWCFQKYKRFLRKI